MTVKPAMASPGPCELTFLSKMVDQRECLPHSGDTIAGFTADNKKASKRGTRGSRLRGSFGYPLGGGRFSIPRDQIRISKSEIRDNFKCLKHKIIEVLAPDWCFEFRACFVFRDSDFGFALILLQLLDPPFDVLDNAVVDDDFNCGGAEKAAPHGLVEQRLPQAVGLFSPVAIRRFRIRCSNHAGNIQTFTHRLPAPNFDHPPFGNSKS